MTTINDLERAFYRDALADLSTIERVQRGMTYAAGSRDETVASGTSQSLHLENPVDSGRVIVVTLATAYTNNANSIFLTFSEGGTSTGSVLTPINLLQGAAASPAEAVIQFGNNAITGAVPVDIAADFTERAPYRLDTAIIIEPGRAFSVEATVPGPLSESSIAINVVWTELPI